MSEMVGPFKLSCDERTAIAIVYELISSTTVFSAPSCHFNVLPPAWNVSGYFEWKKK